MNARAMLTVLLFLALRATCQDAVQTKTPAQCKFSDGKKITVTYSLERRSYLLSTNEPLFTAGGVTVPAGDYTVIRGWDRYGHFLILHK